MKIYQTCYTMDKDDTIKFFKPLHLDRKDPKTETLQQQNRSAALFIVYYWPLTSHTPLPPWPEAVWNYYFTATHYPKLVLQISINSQFDNK